MNINIFKHKDEQAMNEMLLLKIDVDCLISSALKAISVLQSQQKMIMIAMHEDEIYKQRLHKAINDLGELANLALMEVEKK